MVDLEHRRTKWARWLRWPSGSFELISLRVGEDTSIEVLANPFEECLFGATPWPHAVRSLESLARILQHPYACSRSKSHSLPGSVRTCPPLPRRAQVTQGEHVVVTG